MSRCERRAPSEKEYRTFLECWPPSHGWQGTGMRLPWRWSSLSRRFLCFLYVSPAPSCGHTRRLKIWANGLERNDTSWHAHHRAVAGYIRNHQGICTDHDVVTNCDTAHDLAASAKITIVSDGGPTGTPDVCDRYPLVNCATVSDALC